LRIEVPSAIGLRRDVEETRPGIAGCEFGARLPEPLVEPFLAQVEAAKNFSLSARHLMVEAEVPGFKPDPCPVRADDLGAAIEDRTERVQRLAQAGRALRRSTFAPELVLKPRPRLAVAASQSEHRDECAVLSPGGTDGAAVDVGDVERAKHLDRKQSFPRHQDFQGRRLK
jgi:hypothetical protein